MTEPIIYFSDRFPYIAAEYHCDPPSPATRQQRGSPRAADGSSGPPGAAPGWHDAMIPSPGAPGHCRTAQAFDRSSVRILGYAAYWGPGGTQAVQ
eukprot:16441-Hanusia_phi.AAC.1